MFTSEVRLELVLALKKLFAIGDTPILVTKGTYNQDAILTK